MSVRTPFSTHIKASSSKMDIFKMSKKRHLQEHPKTGKTHPY
jgi:hypothetical protein